MGNNIDERVNMASPMRNLESVEHKDLSGANSITYDNPHDALLEASGGDPVDLIDALWSYWAKFDICSRGKFRTYTIRIG